MSNNAHELSNRLLNALDSNYNVSLRVLKTQNLISESEIRKRSARACVTPDSRCDSASRKVSSLLLSCCSERQSWGREAPRVGGRWCGAFHGVNVMRVWVRDRSEWCTATDVASRQRSSLPSVPVPNVLQCESMEWCHAWPFPKMFVGLWSASVESENVFRFSYLESTLAWRIPRKCGHLRSRGPRTSQWYMMM